MTNLNDSSYILIHKLNGTGFLTTINRLIKKYGIFSQWMIIFYLNNNNNNHNKIELHLFVFQVNFWVQQEILNCRTLKTRAEVMSHFIRIAKVRVFFLLTL